MCPDRETLSAYYDNETAKKFSSKITNHIKTCEDCRSSVAAMENASILLNKGFDNIDNAKNRVWDNIQNELDIKNVPDIWHRKINIPVPLIAAASFLIITITALLSTLLFYAGRNDYRNFTVTEAVNINGENQYYIFENEQTVNVEFQLPEEAFFKISGTPQLIREVDYLKANE